MSAKESNRTALPTLPNLPPEIWLTILREATTLPHLLDTEKNNISFVLTSATLKTKALRKNLRTKAQLARVCRYWHIWVTPFLYEAIIVRKEHGLQSLAYALRNTESPDPRDVTPLLGPGGYGLKPYGHYTRYFEISVTETPIDDDHNVWNLLTEVTYHLPFVENLIFSCNSSNERHIPTALVEALALTCGPSLRVINWYTTKLLPYASDLLGLLLHSPNLRSLSCQWFFSRQTKPANPWYAPQNATPEGHVHPTNLDRQDPTAHLSLPRLRDLDFITAFLGGDPQLPIQLDAPHQFRRVILSERHFSEFLQLHGLHLMHLQFSPVYYNIANINTYFTRLRDLCPRLEILDLKLPSWFDLPLHLELPPSVRQFGIACQPSQARNRVYVELVERFDMCNFGLVQSVKLLDERNVRDIRQHPRALGMILEVLEKKKITLLDDKGQRIQVDDPKAPAVGLVL